MKTINFELSKRLNDLGLLDNIETEWKIQLLPNKNGNKWNKGRLVKNWNGKGRIYKTLTLEEAIEFLPERLDIKIFNSNDKYDLFYLQINKFNGYNITYLHTDKNKCIDECKGDTLLEAIEKMIEYLLDNNLITK